MATTKTKSVRVKSTEELIVDEWLYIIKLLRVHDSIVLPDEAVTGLLPGCLANDASNDRLSNSFELRKRRSVLICQKTGIDLVKFRHFIDTELQKSGSMINLNLQQLLELDSVTDFGLEEA